MYGIFVKLLEKNYNGHIIVLALASLLWPLTLFYLIIYGNRQTDSNSNS